MGQEIGSTTFTPQDFEWFEERVREETALLGEWFTERRLDGRGDVGGFELEAWLVDGQARPSPINSRFIECVGDDLVVPELASFNVELNGSPQALKGPALSAMQADLQKTWECCNRTAKGLEAELVMIGTLPTASEGEFNLNNMSSMKRYQALNEQVLRLRGGRPIELNIDGRDRLYTEHADLMLEAATTSFQIHLQVAPDEAARFYNAAKIVSAPMVAIAANSPFLFGYDLWDETRIPLFEQAVSVEGPFSPNRVTYGDGFLNHSLFECFETNRDAYPVLLPKSMSDDPEELSHLRLHNGTIWRWNRPLIGFDDSGTPHLRIEHRVVPAGPSVVDCIANAALFFGLVIELGRSEQPPESRIEFAVARDGFYQAAREGLNARITWLDGRTVGLRELLQEELLPLAIKGLNHYGLDAGDIRVYSEVIAGRLATGRNGATWQRDYIARHGRDMQALAQAYIERQRSGSPVHEWSV